MLFKNILVPIDFSETSLQALRLAVRLARHGQGRITLLHVGVTPVPIVGDIWLPSSAEIYTTWQTQLVDEQAAALRRVAREEIPEDVPHTTTVRDGFPPEEILEEVRTGNHDLVVMATHGRTGLERVVMGSVAERVIRQSPVPVLSLR